MSRVLLEVCLDSPTSAVAAEDGGAGRVELCADLDSGGTTPSSGTIAMVRECIEIPLHVMIRPHAGWSCSDMDFEVMKHDIQEAKKLGSNGVVLGILNLGREIDMERMAEAVALARPMSVTFHRAFDLLRDPVRGLEKLIELGVNRVLTAGGDSTADAGAERIAELVRCGGERITIIAGGGINPRNVRNIIARTGVREVHALGAVTAIRSSDHAGTIFPGKHVVETEKVIRLIEMTNNR